ncbi:MAG: septal ring lytic transglycosylase RlpA family protein [Bacteroidia bacterium]|nr:septal ring lytic transglycosylase RlpA family protein [Bacteroidia bacterium]
MRFLLLSLCMLSGWHLAAQTARTETGNASYYADKFHGRPTASGELYDRNKFTAAHKTLPHGTYVKVTNLTNNRSTVVRINDRLPRESSRSIDLSRAAAEQIGMIQAGVVRVRMEVTAEVVETAGPAPAGEDELGQPAPQPPPAQAPPPPSRVVDVSGLPLRDHNGNLITPGGTQTPAPPPAADAAQQEELRKYTPALFRAVVIREPDATGFAVQTGAFTSYYRMMEALDNLSAKGYQNTLIHNGVKDGRPVYRILVGPYAAQNEAAAVKKKLESLKIQGLVVRLQDLK